jgi:hypothetical protein
MMSKEEIDRCKEQLANCHEALERIADDRGMDDVAHILWSWAGGMTIDEIGYSAERGEA